MTDDAPRHSAQGQEVNIGRQRLGAIYAQALLGTTEPHQQSEVVVEELEALVDEALQQHPQLEAILASPRISPDEKASLLDRVLGGRVSEQLLTFLKVVGRHGRLDCIRQIRWAARAELSRIRNRLPVQVTTAQSLDPELQQRIVGQLQHKLNREVELQCHVDADIVGGLVIRVGDTVFDASVANRLARLKEETINKTSLAFRESTDRFAVSG